MNTLRPLITEITSYFPTQSHPYKHYKIYRQATPLVCRALELHTTLCNEHKNTVFCWLPSHVGIWGNEAADRVAKGALTSAVSIAEVPGSDWKPKAIQFVQNIRNRNLEEAQSNKLKEIVPNLKERPTLMVTLWSNDIIQLL